MCFLLHGVLYLSYYLIGIYSLHSNSIACFAPCSFFVAVALTFVVVYVQNVSLEYICEAILTHCVATPRGRDNMTVMLIRFKITPAPPPPPPNIPPAGGHHDDEAPPPAGGHHDDEAPPAATTAEVGSCSHSKSSEL